jgi:hypothetical protein
MMPMPGRSNYRYMIFRHVPDLARMEPANIGVVVQGDDGAAVRLRPQYRPRHPYEKTPFYPANFAAWKQWLRGEVGSKAGAGFIPERTSAEFLAYLRSRCTENYQFSEPLLLETPIEGVKAVAAYLYEAVVGNPRVEDEADAIPSPASLFRLEVDHLPKPVKSQVMFDVPLRLAGQWCTFPYHYRNGALVTIDKVELAPDPRALYNALDSVCFRLDALDREREVAPSRAVVLVDPVERFAMFRTLRSDSIREAYQNRVRQIREHDVSVVAAIDDVPPLLQRLQEDLTAAH